MKMNLRGTGFRHTLPAAFRFSALWLIMLVLTPPIVTVALMTNGIIPPEARGDVWFFLLTRMPIVVFAGIGLAIFTTARVAGPMVLLKRAFEDVAQGDLDRRLVLRRGDRHFQGVETAFNEMMVSLNERADLQAGHEAEDQAHSLDSANAMPTDSAHAMPTDSADAVPPRGEVDLPS